MRRSKRRMRMGWPSVLQSSCGQSSDEVALEHDVDDENGNDGNEGRREDEAPTGAVLTLEERDGDGQGALVHVVEHRQCPSEFIPGAKESEDDARTNGWFRQRHGEIPEAAPRPRSINRHGLIEFVRNLLEESSEQER